MDAARGGTRGRGGQRGRSGRGGRGGGGPGAPPLAAQMRQIQRLEEPKEMALLRRYRDLGVTRVTSTYTLNGLVDQSLWIPTAALPPNCGLEPGEGELTEISLLEAEDALLRKRDNEARERALNRAEARLGRSYARWGDVPQEEKELLLLSNAEWARRYPNGRPGGGAD